MSIQYKVKRFSIKRRILKSLVKGAKGQGNKFENMAAKAVIKGGQVKNKVKADLMTGNPGNLVTKGTTKAASTIIQNPSTVALQGASSAVPATLLATGHPALASAYMGNPVGPGKLLAPATIKLDRKLSRRFPKIKKTAEKIENFPNTKTGQKVSESISGVIHGIKNSLPL